MLDKPRSGTEAAMQAGVDCRPGCPVARTADVISGKWTTLIIRELLSGTKRYTELQHALLGVSPKVLAQRLKMLEEAGLVIRTLYPAVPPRTDYRLTDLGRALEPVVRAMAEFGLRLAAAEGG